MDARKKMFEMPLEMAIRRKLVLNQICIKKRNETKQSIYQIYTIECRKQNYIYTPHSHTHTYRRRDIDTNTDTDTESIGRMNSLAKRIKWNAHTKLQKAKGDESGIKFFFQPKWSKIARRFFIKKNLITPNHTVV